MTSTSLHEEVEVARGTKMSVDRMDYCWHPFATRVLMLPPCRLFLHLSGRCGFPSAAGTWTQLWPPVAMSRNFAAADDETWPVDDDEDGEGGYVGALLRASTS